MSARKRHQFRNSRFQNRHLHR